MSERKHYSEDELDQITEAVWGTGLYQPRVEQYKVPCPRCGSDIRVHVAQTIRRPPPRFRAICSTCGIDSSGKATSVEMQQLTEKEMDEILELHLRGQRTICPACASPLDVDELPIVGRGTRHFRIQCFRCGTRGQRRLSPKKGDRR